ncbi:cytochrome p450 domain-containing protein [Hirsutella rhossiliensis]|uniref:Cytochrome p450 domain-containing protein n=1 Tax=Hirsutella rhossiliensis TaxID=111463 RepID=A0A9P8MZY7_9HYPO|nr:cytochrome p450 domain-containing protein [Hirsutella rhossiliensis]KAH0962217.1 cytochrome p450 domain-containing protein [Hirsutella rhossiliensis]
MVDTLRSAIKEAQRLKPIDLVTMSRIVSENTIIAGDLKIRKGERIAVDVSSMMDPAIYGNPENFDIYRFVHLSEKPDWTKRGLYQQVRNI